MTIHRVTVATSSAAIPDGTVCSAQHTPPFPTHSSNTPETAAVFHCLAVGLAPVFHLSIGYSNPTARCRVPANNNGGNDSTPTFIA
jgi:hypothetical protein